MKISYQFIMRAIKHSLLVISLLFLSGCFESPKTPVEVVPPEPEPEPEPETLSVSGGGVKGPMALADVTVYAIDPSAENFKGAIAGSGNTNAEAQIENLSLTFPLSPPYILEISANDNTIDITTGVKPVITNVKTILTDDLLSSGEQIYATPLTDMTVSLIFNNADSDVNPYTGNNDGTTTNEEILAAMMPAQAQVKSTMGFGLGDDIDIFSTPPLINSTTNSEQDQTSTAVYRSAVEALTAVVFEMQKIIGDEDISTDNILNDMAADLSDGEIDGVVDGVETESYPEAALDVLEQDPATLPIPNDPEGRTVADVKDVVIEETAQTGNETTNTTAFEESEEEIAIEPAETSSDIDGDGVLNSDDAYPEDASADSDFDQDGTPDIAYVLIDGVRSETIDEVRSDADDDNDGVNDENDQFPLDATEHTDTDLDGIGNNADTDDDNDSVLDVDDDFPLDSTKSDAVDQDSDGWAVGQDNDDNDADVPGIGFVDTDGDGQADSGGLAPDSDDDNDGVNDENDAFPLDATETSDLDGDTIGDNVDTDIDGDGVANSDDLFPRDPFETIDTDNDGIGNNTDTDDDGDNLSDEQEIIIGTDPLDNDTDDDGVFDDADALPLDPTERFDSDHDGIGNGTDNCPLVANSFQVNSDDDELGDACDTDDDNDGVLDVDDGYPLDPNLSVIEDADNDGWPTEQDPDDSDANNPGTAFIDTDGDGTGDTTDNDDDGDGVNDADDQFPLDINEWLDTDGDGLGNNADEDDDNDQYPDADEELAGSDPLLSSSIPADFDGDFIADVRDNDIDNDGVENSQDAFDFDATESVDTDGDGIGNNADTDDDGDGFSDANEIAAGTDPTSNTSIPADMDGDFIPDVIDEDRDGDGTNNDKDAFPNDDTETLDTDGDGIGNNADTDDDGDGVADTDDAFPLNSNETLDTDGDGIGNNTDTDDDGDGVADTEDAFPLDRNETLDTDGDGIGNNADTDDDGDGVADTDDAFPLNSNETLDTDGDGIGNNTDTDDDGDGVADGDDAFPLDESETLDTDGDGTGNNTDTDDDGVADGDDAFPLDESETLDTDGDGIGNNADTDDDGDGFSDANEETVGTDPLDVNSVPADLDGDFIPDQLDEDLDGDGVNNDQDSFPNDPAETIDTDGDLIGDNSDNCPATANEDQDDVDSNGIGDACDQFSFDLTGPWLANLTNTSSGENGECHADNDEVFIISVVQEGEVFTFADEDNQDDNKTKVTGIIDHAGNFTFTSSDDESDLTSSDGKYDTTTNTLTFTFTETRNANTDHACVETGTIYARGFIAENEQQAFATGISWFESNDEHNDDGHLSSLEYVYGTLMDSTAESQFVYDIDSSMFVTHSDENPDRIVTANGVLVNEDNFTIVGYLEDGETALISTTAGEFKINLTAVDIQSLPLTQLLDDGYRGVIAGNEVFSVGAQGYLFEVIRNADEYSFYCGDWIAEQLNCSNGIPVSWENDQPELATSLSEIVNHPSMTIGDAIGGIWVGRNHDYSIEAFLYSNDGTINGGNLIAKFIKRYNNGEAGVLVDTVAVTKTTVGNNDLYSYAISTTVHDLLGDEVHEEDKIPFVFEDSETEPGQTFVRRGSVKVAGTEEMDEFLFNDTAKADILAAFSFDDLDGDGIPNELDQDKDGDGYLNENDDLPLDESEWLDSDGDGVGDNADTDIDGDGVLNDDDLDAYDPNITIALDFVEADLLASYVQITQGYLTNPDFKLGFSNGQTYHFTSGNVSIHSPANQDNYSYLFDSGIMTATSDTAVESQTNIEVSELANIGVISAEQASNFIEQHGDIQITISQKEVSFTWQRLAPVGNVHKFWRTSTVEYTILDGWQREQLMGAVDAAPVSIDDESSMLELTDLADLPLLTWTTDELTATPMAMPLIVDLENNSDFSRISSDIFIFDINGTVTSTISGDVYNWEIDSAGILHVHLSDEISVAAQKSRIYEAGFGVYFTISDGDKMLNSFSLVVAQDINASITPLVNKYLQNGFYLTDTGSYNEEGELINFFGFRLESGGARVTRIFSPDFDFDHYQANWDRWYWGMNEDNLVTIQGLWHSEQGNSAQCNPISDDQCNRYRLRHWQPLAQVGDRIYVLEWEERNNNTWNFPSETEDLYVAIAPRIQFYQVHDIDSDKDGILDSIDSDDDNDGVADEDDEFPFDRAETVDNDGDYIGDNLDSDDDNDGVNDNDDAFPNDETEWEDLDGDGIGNNSDTDIDGDGVNNDDDIAPYNDEVALALSFTASELLSSYIAIDKGHLANPDFRLGRTNGSTYNFDNNVLVVNTSFEESEYSYQFDNNVMTAIPNQMVESTTHIDVSDLADMGIISWGLAQPFIDQHGDHQIEVVEKEIFFTWQRLDVDADNYRFYQTATYNYRLTKDWEREQLLGSIDAEDVTLAGESTIVHLQDLATLELVTWTEEELTAQPFAMPLVIDMEHEEQWFRVSSDIFTFNSIDTSATGEMSGVSFTWVIDGSGLLQITFDNGVLVTAQKSKVFQDSYGVLFTITNGDKTLSSYTLVVPVETTASITHLVNLYLQNSFSLTNPDAYNEQGELTDFFGFRVESSGKRVTRLLSDDFDFSKDKAGWDRWYWHTDDSNVITMQSHWHSQDEQYSSCNVENNDQCNRYRLRKWQPLAQVGDRLYVLEWEERNRNTWNFPSEEEDLYLAIAPRIQFYQVHDIDSDKDGVLDSLDIDDDNDGVSDEDDAFPFDATESIDSDGDGVGDNADAFPDDATEVADSDGDGVGDNLDDFPNDSNYTTGVPLAGITFNDAEFKQCVIDHLKDESYIDRLEELNCSWRNIADLTGLEQLYNLRHLELDGLPLVDNYDAVTSLTNLVHFAAHHNTNFTNAHIIALENHPSLRFIGLNETSVTDISPLATINTLEKLEIMGQDEQDVDLTHLLALPNFKALSIRRNQIVDEAMFAQIANLTTLNELHVHGDVSANDLTVLLSLSNLENLDVGWGSGLGDAEFEALMSTHQNIKWLDFQAVPITSLAPINHLLDVHSVNIQYTNVTDLSELFVNGDMNNEPLPNLNYVNIGMLPVIEGSNIEYQVQRLRDFGIFVDGELARGQMLATYLDGIEDPALKQCIIDNTAGQLVTGQLTSLWCDNRSITNIWGLSAFYNLEEIHLNGTAITQVHGEFDNMQKLRIVDVGNTQLNNLGGLEFYSHLESLNIDNLPLENPEQINGYLGNGLSGNVRSDLLADITFSDAGLTTCFDNNKGDFIYVAQLHHLHCSSDITMSNIEGLDQLYGLKDVKIPNDPNLNTVVLNDYSPLFNLPQLDNLSLGDHAFNDVDLLGLSTSVSGIRLMDLWLAGTNVTDLSHLTNSKNLVFIHLWGSTTYDLSPLASLPKLSGIALSTHQLDSPDSNIDAIKLLDLPHLRTLYLHGPLTTSEVGDSDPASVIPELLNLEFLSIGYDGSVDNAFLSTISNTLINIRWGLELNGSAVFDLTPVEALINLQSISLNDTPVTDLSPLINLRTHQDQLKVNDESQNLMERVFIFNVNLVDNSQNVTLEELGIIVNL